MPHHHADLPNLLRDVYSYNAFPRLVFDRETVASEVPESVWLTDTTFRDGQQARAPYSPEHVLGIYDRLHRIDGGCGLIRQCEFFLYTEQDRRAVARCRERGYRFPEITGWMRALPGDLAYVLEAGLTEVGVLASVSDYHIFLKLNQTRTQAMRTYLDILRLALDQGLHPRCHFEDVTRADYDGFVRPLAAAVLALGEEAGTPIKIRLCDTLGLGVPYAQAAVPRSVPKLIQGLRQLGVPAEQLEWHGHNDFHKAAVNAAAAWLYGCCSVNCALFGAGERSGNPPLEALVVEHAQLKGMQPQVNYAALSELADYARQEAGFDIPANYPLVGQAANVTSAGIHADGLLKHEEIYSGCNTGALLNRPPHVALTNRSGLAGIVHWIETHFQNEVSKHDPRLRHIQHRIDDAYTRPRASSISDVEMRAWVLDAFSGDFPATPQQ
jgi:isopropylmalate/homocitrate/citramalate synthase